ncbi:MAG: hypothetical protein NTY22_03410 [Proteobacteria bacterium]|nr:hypothetical protein [Pseudomonadota bacterium]
MFKNIFSGIAGFGYNLKKSTMLNKHTPSENRYAAYEYFQEKISKAQKENNLDVFNDVIQLFLSRFTIAVSNSIKDDEEKNYIKDYLESLGDVVVEPIKRFIIKDHIIAYPIEILISIIGKEKTLDFLNTVLTTEDTLFDDPLVEKRIEILKQFAGATHSDMLSKASIFLNDSDDRLVIASIRFIRDYAFSEDEDMDKISEAMALKFVDTETSARIRIELLNVFIEQEWKVSGVRKQFEELLPEGYYINTQGFIRVIQHAITNPSSMKK